MRGLHLLRPGCWAVALLLATVLASQSGCVGLAAHVMYFIYGNKVPADYDGLEDRRVAVICVAGNGSDDPQSASRKMAKGLSILLAKEVPGIEVVRQDQIANWKDNNDWDGIDYIEVGRGVKAQSLVVVELNNYRLHEGATIYKGRADINITVYDMTKDGMPVYEDSEPDFTFPVHAGVSVLETSETGFENMFLKALIEEVSIRFYDYDAARSFGSDARTLHTDQ